MVSPFASSCMLIQGLPPGALCGIDLLSFSVRSNVYGVKDLPSGWHFIFVSQTNSMSLRHGAWFKVNETGPHSPPDLFIVKWMSEAEELVFETDQTAIMSARANIGSLWRSLLPYRQSPDLDDAESGDAELEAKVWRSLTDCVSSGVLSRIAPAQPSTSFHILTSASSAVQDEDHIPGISSSDFASTGETVLQLMPINLKQTWPDKAEGRERTEKAQDRSWALEQIIKDYCREPRDLIGEFQFCFVMTLTLNNHSCAEQWKRLITIVLTCKSVVEKEAAFFAKFLNTLQLQCENSGRAQESLIDLSDDGPHLIQPLLARFRTAMEDVPRAKVSTVLEAIDEFEDSMVEKHNWHLKRERLTRGMVDLEDGERVEMDYGNLDEENEEGEYAPVIVQLEDS